MENELVTFSNDDFGQLNTVEIENEPWFVGKDVARILGYKNTKDALLKHVDQEDRKVLKTADVSKRSQNATFEIPTRGLTVINESGLYSLILSSKLPQARQFKRWVTSEVLPSIRAHGLYATKETVSRFLANPDAMAELLNQISDERDNYLSTRQELVATQNKLAQAQHELDRKYHPVLVRKDDPESPTVPLDYLLDLFRHEGIHITRPTLFRFLRKQGYILPDSPLPSFDAIKDGFLTIVENITPSGSRYYTTGVTIAGQLHFGLVAMHIASQRKKVTK